jgi:hypothetical protein
MPDYRAVNPYQGLLAEALSQRDVDVQFANGYRRGLPLRRAWRDTSEASVQHLHWISPYLRGRNVLTQAACCLGLLADVILLQAFGVGDYPQPRLSRIQVACVGALGSKAACGSGRPLARLRGALKPRLL